MNEEKRQWKWFGYLEKNGTIHVKRYSDEWGDAVMHRAGKSTSVDDIYGPFEAADPNEAMEILKKVVRWRF